MPPKSFSKSEIGYYGTLTHELSHMIGNMLGDIESNESIDAYSREELIAEFTSAFVLGSLGVVDTESDEIKNSESYIYNWSRRIEKEPRLMLHAAMEGQRRGSFILNNNLPLSMVKNPESFPFLCQPELCGSGV